MTSFYSEEELAQLGLKSFGSNVLISRFASIYSPQNISIGSNVRIDDFCILSGKISIGDWCHISAYCSLYGSMGIAIEGYCGISPRSTILSATDDFSGDWLIGPQYPKDLTNITGGTVVLSKFSQIGTNNVVFPNITVGTGAVTGAMTLVNKNLNPWTQNFGVPVREVKPRKQGLLEKIEQFNSSYNISGGGCKRLTFLLSFSLTPNRTYVVFDKRSV